MNSLQNFLKNLTPCVLVIILLPFFFIAFPNGLAFIYAACPTATLVPISNLFSDVQSPCLTAEQTAVTDVDSFSLSTLAGGKCRYNASVTFEIFPTGCVVQWNLLCGTGGVCATSNAATGPFSGTRNISVECNESGNSKPGINLVITTSCPVCSPDPFFTSLGDCNVPP